MTKNQSINTSLIGKKFIISEIGNPELALPPFNKEASWRENCVYKHTVVVIHNQQKIQFQFYSNIHDRQKGKKYLDEDDLLGTFMTLFNEALIALDAGNPKGLANELGYPTDTRQEREELEKVYKALNRQLNKVKKLGISENEIFKIVDELNM